MSLQDSVWAMDNLNEWEVQYLMEGLSESWARKIAREKLVFSDTLLMVEMAKGKKTQSKYRSWVADQRDIVLKQKEDIKVQEENVFQKLKKKRLMEGPTLFQKIRDKRKG
jgi:predicted protein tyrosine phosphatase